MRPHDRKPSISLVFPLYKDEGTVRQMTEKARAVLSEISSHYEIVMVDDGSPDKSGEIADQLAREYPEVRAFHHPRNIGYGKALQTALSNVGDVEWVCMVDGDDQYDVRELYHLVTLLPRYDVLITFRFCKIYSTWRIFLSFVYNWILRLAFRSNFRDVSCGLKLFRKQVIESLSISSNSPFVGAEMTLKAMLKGYMVGEVGINTYPRSFGQSSAASPANIRGTAVDLFRIRREVFVNTPRERIPRE